MFEPVVVVRSNGLCFESIAPESVTKAPRFVWNPLVVMALADCEFHPMGAKGKYSA